MRKGIIILILYFVAVSLFAEERSGKVIANEYVFASIEVSGCDNNWPVSFMKKVRYLLVIGPLKINEQ